MSAQSTDSHEEILGTRSVRENAKIIIERHPSKIDKDGRRHYLIRAIPYQDPSQEAEHLKAVHEARIKIVLRVGAGWFPTRIVPHGAG